MGTALAEMAVAATPPREGGGFDWGLESWRDGTLALAWLEICRSKKDCGGLADGWILPWLPPLKPAAF